MAGAARAVVALVALTLPVLADEIPPARQGTRIVWAEPGDPRPAMTWTVTGAGGGIVDISEETAGAERPVRIADGVFPIRRGDGAARFDRGRLAALRPLEPARIVTFDAEEADPHGIARWFVHVTVTDRHAIQVPAGRFEVVMIEHHRRGTGGNGVPAETIVEWSVAPAIGLPVMIRTWRIEDGRPELTGDLRAAAIHVP